MHIPLWAQVVREAAPGPFLLLPELGRAAAVGRGWPWQSCSFGKHPLFHASGNQGQDPPQQPNFSSKPQEEIFARGRVSAALTTPALLENLPTASSTQTSLFHQPRLVQVTSILNLLHAGLCSSLLGLSSTGEGFYHLGSLGPLPLCPR